MTPRRAIERLTSEMSSMLGFTSHFPQVRVRNRFLPLLMAQTREFLTTQDWYVLVRLPNHASERAAKGSHWVSYLQVSQVYLPDPSVG